MKTVDAIKVLTDAGYTVQFTFASGAYMVTLWEGCTERLSRLDLIQLAQSLVFVGG